MILHRIWKLVSAIAIVTSLFLFDLDTKEVRDIINTDFHGEKKPLNKAAMRTSQLGN